MVLDGKSSQEYPVSAGFPQVSILRSTNFLLYINNLPDEVMCSISVYADDAILFSKSNQLSDFWRQLDLAA